MDDLYKRKAEEIIEKVGVFLGEEINKIDLDGFEFAEFNAELHSSLSFINAQCVVQINNASLDAFKKDTNDEVAINRIKKEIAIASSRFMQEMSDICKEGVK